MAARHGLMLECPHGPRDTSHTIIHIMIYVRNDFVMESSFFGTYLLEHLHVCILYNLFITLFADISQNVGGALLCFSMDSYTLLPKKGLIQLYIQILRGGYSIRRCQIHPRVP